MAIPSRFHKGDKVYAPRYLIFPERLNARSRYRYAHAVILATGHKKNKRQTPIVKVQFDDGLIKVCLSCDCDRT